MNVYRVIYECFVDPNCSVMVVASSVDNAVSAAQADDDDFQQLVTVTEQYHGAVIGT